MLTAADVAARRRRSGHAITAAEMRLRVALAPLLAGRIDARELVLRGRRHAAALAARPGRADGAHAALAPGLSRARRGRQASRSAAWRSPASTRRLTTGD